MIKGCLLQLFGWTQRDLDEAICNLVVVKIVPCISLEEIGSSLISFRYWGENGLEVVNLISPRINLRCMMLLVCYKRNVGVYFTCRIQTHLLHRSLTVNLPQEVRWDPWVPDVPWITVLQVEFLTILHAFLHDQKAVLELPLKFSQCSSLYLKCTQKSKHTWSNIVLRSQLLSAIFFERKFIKKIVIRFLIGNSLQTAWYIYYFISDFLCKNTSLVSIVKLTQKLYN